MSDEDTITSGEGQDGPGGGNADDTVASDSASDQTAEVDIQKQPDVETGNELLDKEPEKAPEPAKPETVNKTRQEPQLSDAQKRLAELDAKIDDEYFDANSKEGKAVLKEHARVAAKVEAEPIRRQANRATVFDDLEEELEIPANDLRTIWKDVQKTMPAEFKNNEGAMNYAFRQRVAAVKEARKAPPKQKPAPTKAISPGQVLPRGAGSIPPAPSEEDTRTIEERVIAGDKSMIGKFQEAYEGFFGRKG